MNQSVVNSLRMQLKPIDWSQYKVFKWLNENRFHPSIILSLKYCNGDLLFHMFRMYKKTPQFFYDKLIAESKTDLTLTEIGRFTNELEKLFPE